MNTLRSLILAGVVLTLLLIAAWPAVAAPALDFTAAGTLGGGHRDEILGWRFTVASPIIVGALGLFDFGANGLVNSHQIGLWTSGGTLLTSATTTTANSSPVASTSGQGNWRFTVISPLILLPGEYVVGASYIPFDDDKFWMRTTAATVPEVTFDAARWCCPSGAVGLTFPSIEASFDNAGYFGPNLDVVATPEPMTMVLGATGLLSLAYAGRRRLFGR